MSERDPIFTLIENQRRLEAEWERLAESDEAPFGLIEQKRDDAGRASHEGLCELVRTTPSTVAGVRAVLAYVSSLVYAEDVPLLLIDCMQSCAALPPLVGGADGR
jgi:hypothetical protein